LQNFTKWQTELQSDESLVVSWIFSCQISKKFFFKKFARFYPKFPAGSQKNRRMLEFFSFHIFLSPNLAKSSYGWLPLWLHHKIENIYITWWKYQAKISSTTEVHKTRHLTGKVPWSAHQQN
jgi:hypothetical protein